MQYLDTGWVNPMFTSLLVFFILFNIWRATAAGKKGRDIYIRRIAGLNAIDEAVGRATEMGRPVIMVPGLVARGTVTVTTGHPFVAAIGRLGRAWRCSYPPG